MSLSTPLVCINTIFDKQNAALYSNDVIWRNSTVVFAVISLLFMGIGDHIGDTPQMARYYYARFKVGSTWDLLGGLLLLGALACFLAKRRRAGNVATEWKIVE